MKPFFLFLAIVLLLAFPSCDILRQAGEMNRLSKCEFRISTISNINLAGVNISGVQHISDINPFEMLQITNAAIKNQLPLNFILNLEVKNPNNQTASFNRVEWIIFIDDLQMLEGVIQERFSIGAFETSILPVQIGFNLAEMLKDERVNKIIDFAQSLANESGTTTRIMIKLKPSAMVGRQSIQYPGWITVRNEFVSK